MEATVVEKKGIIHVTLSGDIYVDQTDELLDAFNSIIEKRPNQVIIDVSGLKSITSSGIGQIVLLYKGVHKYDGRIRIKGVNNVIMQIFRMVKLDKLVEIEGMSGTG